MSETSLIILEGPQPLCLCTISVAPLNIFFFPTCENEKENFCDFLHTFTMVSILGGFLYLTMIFKIGSLMLFTIGS